MEEPQKQVMIYPSNYYKAPESLKDVYDFLIDTTALTVVSKLYAPDFVPDMIAVNLKEAFGEHLVQYVTMFGDRITGNSVTLDQYKNSYLLIRAFLSASGHPILRFQLVELDQSKGRGHGDRIADSDCAVDFHIDFHDVLSTFQTCYKKHRDALIQDIETAEGHQAAMVKKMVTSEQYVESIRVLCTQQDVFFGLFIKKD